MTTVSPLSLPLSNIAKKAVHSMKAHSKGGTVGFLLSTEVTVGVMKLFSRVMLVVEENNPNTMTMGLCISQLV